MEIKTRTKIGKAWEDGFWKGFWARVIVISVLWIAAFSIAEWVNLY